MSFRTKTTALFKKQLKRLAKKFPSLTVEYGRLLQTLHDNPTLGTAIGHDSYKIRLAIKSKGKGKSGGARVITYVRITEESIVLLSIYDKSEQSNISDADLQALIATIDEG